MWLAKRLCLMIGVIVYSRGFSLRGLQIRNRLRSAALHLTSIPTPTYPVKVAYQGESGAYSEKAARELLGTRISTVPYSSFEEAFKAVASREVDYAVVPIENSLGGSIHTNFDLLLRYDLHIIAEHEFKVEHCLLALPGVKREDIKKVMSHPQALAQVDKYLRGWPGVTAVPTYDTAGSAKMIKEQQLTDCAAVASDLAAATFGLEVMEAGIEDHDNNFTRFLLLSRSAVSALLPPHSPAKTSLVFVLPNIAGALYKALACFSLRDIDFSKIESRPTSVDLLGQLSSTAVTEGSAGDLPRFRYTFYLDFLAPQYSDGAQNALLHLKEQSEFVRVLGSYPSSGTGLVGPVKAALAALDAAPLPTATTAATIKKPAEPAATIITNNKQVSRPLSIAIIGFGKFGQFLAKTFIKQGHTVKAIDKDDMSAIANEIGADFHPLYDLSPLLRQPVDVLLLSVSIISFEEVLRTLPRELFSNRLVVDVLSVKVHAKETMLKLLPSDCDILCSHPMFGPESGKHGWQGLPFLFDRIRVNTDTGHDRTQRFLNIWEAERCKMIEMTCEKHDEYAANSQFITHLTGRILGQQNLQPTPIDTKGFQTVLTLVENTCKDSFDLFFGLYYYNSYAASQLQRIREALAKVERQLAAKEAYLAARSEASNEQRGRILEECRSLIKEALSDFVSVTGKNDKGEDDHNNKEKDKDSNNR